MPDKNVNPRDLRNNPTTFAWAVELRRLLHGEREVSLLRLQSVQAYVNKILSRSEDESLARACFQDALRGVVEVWQPNERRSKEYLACMLDLIGAYRPLEAASKIAGLLTRWGTFSEDIESSDGYGAESDLNLKSLVVLGEYFQAPPHNELATESRIFQTYVEILLEYLETPRYGGYVAGRLIELGVIQFADQRIGRLIRSDPEATFELLSLLLSPARRARLRTDSRSIISHVDEASVATQQLFERILQANNASVVEAASGSFIVLEGQDSVEIPQNRADSDELLAVTPNGSQIQDSMKLNVELNRLPELLTRRDEEAQTIVSTIFERCLITGSNAIEHFDSKLREVGARLEHDKDGVSIVITQDKRFQPGLSQELLVRYIGWYSWRANVPATTDMIQVLTAAG